MLIFQKWIKTKLKGLKWNIPLLVIMPSLGGSSKIVYSRECVNADKESYRKTFKGRIQKLKISMTN